MKEEVYRTDLAGTIVPVAVREGQCPHCGCDLDTAGRCSQAHLCDEMRRRADAARVERHG